ncbi:hypothetical protein BJ912DRAFT_1103891 [Pholiota molesta]|nr:hypothetical protein BJ912DRAFT_1103891 [Pholiota molesta]
MLGHRATHNDPEVFPTVSVTGGEWEAALVDIGTEWKMSSSGCAIIIPLCIGLFQLNAVAQNVSTRTAILAAFLFATAGLALGARLTARLPQFNTRKCRNAWESASCSCADLDSVEFWSLLAFPMALLLWSAILCVMSVLILAWTSQDGSVVSDSRAKIKDQALVAVSLSGSNITNKERAAELSTQTTTTATAPFQTPSCARRRPSQDMLKLLQYPHSPLLCRPILHLAKSISSTRPPPPPEYTSLDAFRKRLDHKPTYALPSFFRRIELTARSTGQPAAVYEAAFDALLWGKRLADAASVLVHMPKKGILVREVSRARREVVEDMETGAVG